MALSKPVLAGIAIFGGAIAANLAAEYAIAKITASKPDSWFAFGQGKFGGDDVLRAGLTVGVVGVALKIVGVL